MLLHRARQLVPELHCGFEHIRLEPSAELKQRRMAFATRQLQRMATEQDFLLNMFCEDEFAMYLANPKDYVVRSWGFRSAQAHAMPNSIMMLGEDDKQVKLHIMLVVSPRYGVVWRNFLTGTSPVDGGHVHLEELMKPSIAARNAEPYKVSGVLHVQYAAKLCVCLLRGFLQLPSHPVHIWLLLSLVDHFNIAVAASQHNKACSLHLNACSDHLLHIAALMVYAH